MRVSFDLREEVLTTIETVFIDMVNTKKLNIELSINEPYNYRKNFHKWYHYGLKVPIEGFYGNYNVNNGQLKIYLPALFKPCSSKSYAFESVFRVILYYEVGQWICNTIELRNNNYFSKEQFVNTGMVFRNFVSMMFAYELMKFDILLLNIFKDFSKDLSDDYTLWLSFIETEEKYNLAGITKHDVYDLINNVVENKNEDISQDFIVQYFDDYVMGNVEQNPLTINHFWDIMTDSQKKRHRGLSKAKEFGLFDD